MEYRTVGKTGIQVSNLCFGAMSFGGDADEETSKAMYKRCREAGINFFDTADVYGRSEEILGECIAHERDSIVLTSKVFWNTGADVNARGLSRKHMMQGIENNQLEDSLAAADFKMTEEMYAEISNLSRTPSPATDRTEVLTGKWK